MAVLQAECGEGSYSMAVCQARYRKGAHWTSQRSKHGSTGCPTPSGQLPRSRQRWGSCWGAWLPSSRPAPPAQTCMTAPSLISPPPCLRSSQSAQPLRYIIIAEHSNNQKPLVRLTCACHLVYEIPSWDVTIVDNFVPDV